LIADAQAFWYCINYHLERGLHAESTYGSFVILGQLLGLTKITDYDWTHGSFDITSALADNLAGASFYIMAFLFLVLCLLFIYQLHKKQIGITDPELARVETETMLVRYFAIAVLAFLATNKVFSAQYMVWFCPLIPLINVRWNNIMVILLMIAGVLSIYMYPFNYVAFEYYEATPVIIMAVRNVLIIAVFIMAFFPTRTPQKQMVT
jgi:hypothetical protein